MSSWRGVPDFSRSLQVHGLQMFQAADEPNLFLYLPARLETAQREGAEGGLDFSIQSVRSVNPFQTKQLYGVLDFGLRPARADVSVLDSLQQAHPQAGLMPALFARGWLRLHRLVDTTAGLPGTDAFGFETPVALAFNGLETARCVRRLDQDELTMLEQVLQDHTLTFGALAEMELWGLATRLPVRLDFVPTDLLRALSTLSNHQGTLSVQALTDFWMQDPSALPITPLEGLSAIDPLQLAQILAAWTLAEFCEYIASPVLPAQPTCRLKKYRDLPAIVRWDLGQEKLVPTIVLLELDPFDAARQAVEAGGLETILTKTVIPTLETGVVSLAVEVNLPTNLQGVLSLGVDLFAPPHPPQRVQPLTASLVFDEKREPQTVNWRFSPVEETTFQYSTFAIVRSSSGIQRLASSPVSHSGIYLLLTTDDFPLAFIPISASNLLMRQAVINGVCHYADPQSDGRLELAFTLDAAHPEITITFPSSSLAQARLHLQACSINEEIVLVMGEFPARSLRLDLFNLREYGLHTIRVEMEFDIPAELGVIDLLPESSLAQPEEATVLSFTPAQPAKSWSYLAASPFHAGYVYRSHPAVGQPSRPWSAVNSPFGELRLKASEL